MKGFGVDKNLGLGLGSECKDLELNSDLELGLGSECKDLGLWLGVRVKRRSLIFVICSLCDQPCSYHIQ